MSGGSLDYFYATLEEHAGDFDDKELDDLVKDLAKLFYEREWYLSADTCEGKWVEARDAFKQKWFTPVGRKDRITSYFDRIRDEMLKSLGLSDEYCINCANWKQEKNPPYGVCRFSDCCLKHRHESCNKFERNERK